MIPGFIRQLFDKRLDPVEDYLRGGRKPWSVGYLPYRAQFIDGILRDEKHVACFQGNGRLPAGYGFGLDERAVEYPWVLSRLSPSGVSILDAGSALNFGFLLEQEVLQSQRIVICNLAPEKLHMRPNVSYVFGDLRDPMFRDDYFDAVVCISTLEHVGMDNTFLYTGDESFKENCLESYLSVVDELGRVLKPDGTLLVTVPYGKYQHMEWQQQFDKDMVDRLIDRFCGIALERVCYGYDQDGWQLSDESSCAENEYFDVRHDERPDDSAAAARSVVCLQMQKKSG